MAQHQMCFSSPVCSPCGAGMEIIEAKQPSASGAPSPDLWVLPGPWAEGMC